MEHAQEFAVVPPPPLAYALFPILWLLISAFTLARTDPTAWHADPVPWWLVPPFGAALILVAPLILLSRKRIAIEGGTLVVHAGLHTRKQAIDDLALEEARIVDLDEHPGYAPMLRLFGAGLPGHKAGHYLLRNRQRAFVLLTRREKVLLLPQRNGKLLLLSPERPQALLDRLRELATAPVR